MHSVYYIFSSLLTALAVLFETSFLVAQVTISGTVEDRELNETLIGASVVIEGTTKGTVTDFDGNFSIEVPQVPIVLIFSYTTVCTGY